MAKKSELKILDGGKLFFTSDTHYGHAAMLRPDYAGRPFDTIELMTEALIANWKERVGPEDTVFHLGDFAMASPKDTANIIRRLPGHKHLLLGNHDIKLRGRHEIESLFEGVWDLKAIRVQDPEATDGWQRITLCHYAMRTWSKAHYGAWQLYGHSHGNLEEFHFIKAMDVGVDAVAKRLAAGAGRLRAPQDYSPISYAEVKVIMKTRVFKAVDHHREPDAENP